VSTAVVSIRGNVGIRFAKTATEETATEEMKHAPSYTLASRPQTGRYLRARAVLLRGTFAATIFLTDIAFIVAMACLTGIAYHLAAYGKPGNVTLFLQVGILAASIFAVSKHVSRRIPAAELLHLQAPWRAASSKCGTSR